MILELELRQYLWCHCGQLSTGFVHWFCFYFHEKWKFFWLIVRICDGCIKTACVSEKNMRIPYFKFHLNDKMKNVYKTNGELSVPYLILSGCFFPFHSLLFWSRVVKVSLAVQKVWYAFFLAFVRLLNSSLSFFDFAKIFHSSCETT